MSRLSTTPSTSLSGSAGKDIAALDRSAVLPEESDCCLNRPHKCSWLDRTTTLLNSLDIRTTDQAERLAVTGRIFVRRFSDRGSEDWNGGEPRMIVTGKLRSYGVVHRELIPSTIHSTEQYENNRAEQSHETTRVRERGMRGFKSMKQAQRFVTAHAAVSNLFNLGRHLVRAEHYRNLRVSAFGEWSRAVA